MKKHKRQLKTKSKYRLGIKIILCILYITVMIILGVSAYQIHKKETQKEVSWDLVETTEEYTYLSISEMSEKFATIDNKSIHFITHRKKSGEWNTYIIAIAESDYESYKDIIDYSYQRTNTVPKTKKVYGYAREMNNNLKTIAIKNIEKFLPFDNEVKLTDENFEKYLSNVYLDTTIEKNIRPNYIITILIVMIVILFVLLIATLFDRDKLVNEIDDLIEVI